LPLDRIGDQSVVRPETEPFDDAENLRAFRGIALGVELSLLIWFVLLFIALKTI
jgi:hypothetical protein